MLLSSSVLPSRSKRRHKYLSTGNGSQAARNRSTSCGLQLIGRSGLREFSLRQKPKSTLTKPIARRSKGPGFFIRKLPTASTTSTSPRSFDSAQYSLCNGKKSARRYAQDDRFFGARKQAQTVLGL